MALSFCCVNNFLSFFSLFVHFHINKVTKECINTVLSLLCCCFPAVLGMATGTRTRHPESTALGHVSWYSLSAACLSAKCAAPMRSHRPMGSGKPSLVSSVAEGSVGCWGG